ncbi:hypothetical protein Pan181_48300 [Aeoliella mucimassa]|uniref:Uncharacterized protein n=2 Tax=Aeoliella mucimassa TaxID=2527972 RepID=A0A518AV43_9BACT|nr:hypothetical protein Pan181_48300 [Aeoliella mucimassa]
MTTSGSIEPLRYPEPWPETSLGEEKWKQVPLVGRYVSVFVAEARLSSVEGDLERQFNLRDPSPVDYWHDDLRRQIAEGIIDACVEAIGWTHSHFVPDDNLGVMISIRTGDLCELDAIFRIEKLLGRRHSKEEWLHLVELTLGEVVELFANELLTIEEAVMIDRPLRDQLAQELRQLVTGKLSNDDFDDSYYDAYRQSSDPAVREVAQFGWSLYSSDVLWPYSLKGWHKVSEATRQRAAHAVLFLRTDLKYVYREQKRSLADMGVCMFESMGCLLGLALFVMAWLVFASDLELAAIFACVGAIALVVSRLMAQVRHADDQSFQVEANKIGDLQVWPFVSKQQLADTPGSGFVTCALRTQP